MNKTKKKYIASKVFGFIGLRAVELTILYFFMLFIFRYFEGWHAYTLLGAATFVYLFYIAGRYIDGYHERHRYDDVVL